MKIDRTKVDGAWRYDNPTEAAFFAQMWPEGFDSFDTWLLGDGQQVNETRVKMLEGQRAAALSAFASGNLEAARAWVHAMQACQRYFSLEHEHYKLLLELREGHQDLRRRLPKSDAEFEADLRNLLATGIERRSLASTYAARKRVTATQVRARMRGIGFK